ncbi:MAG: sigma-70 family RNA polymerase sigma factor [Planctomycetes bacterium]|jgi:RNA polymerase sigma factor (TIGR02999 family)|nr:sigma-70 family RNA polymerase sigma factor [Planctomycetota bacterium]
MSDVTRILNAIERGEARATDELLPLVYEELRLLAAQRLSHEPPGQTLQATALVHEAYLRLLGDQAHHWQGRAHFFGAAAEAMRRILVENARRKGRLKRGARCRRIDLETVSLAFETPPEDLLALEEAFTRLVQEDPEAADVIKLSYFGGLTLEETAEVLGISRRTAQRYWAFARAWLHAEMTKGEEPSSPGRA